MNTPPINLRIPQQDKDGIAEAITIAKNLGIELDRTKIMVLGSRHIVSFIKRLEDFDDDEAKKKLKSVLTKLEQ